MKFEFTREDAKMIRTALYVKLNHAERLAEHGGLMFVFSAKCWKELLENFDRQYEGD